MKKKSVLSRLYLVLTIAYLLAPLAATAAYSLFGRWTGRLPEGFTLEHYRELFTEPDFLLSLFFTVAACLVPIALTVLLVLLALFAAVVCCPRLEKYVHLLCVAPYMLQGVILSVSVISLYAGSPTVLGNRAAMLTGAYCVIILPYIYQGIRGSMRAVNMPMLLEAAEMLGASRLYGYFRVVVPCLLPGITVSSLLAAGIIFGDYVLARNIAGSGFKNVQMYLSLAMRSSGARASAVFTVLLLVVLFLSLLVISLQNRGVKRVPKGRG